MQSAMKSGDRRAIMALMQVHGTPFLWIAVVHCRDCKGNQSL